MQHRFLFILALTNCFALSRSCGSEGEDPAGTRGPPGQPTNPPSQVTNPPSTDPNNNALKKFMGDNAEGSDYDNSGYIGKGGGPINQGSELSCNFEPGSSCCWTNLDGDQMDWKIGSGTSSSRISETLGTSSAPSGSYLWAGSTTPLPTSSEARLGACTIPCTFENVIVTIKHWRTDGPILEVCSRGAFDSNAPLQQCTQVPRSASPGPTQVTLQPGDLFDIVIVARQFTGANGGIVAIDDIAVDFTLCPESTTSSGGTTSGGGGNGGTVDAALCNQIQCNFESGSLCSYKDAVSSSNTQYGGTKSFTVTSKRTGNSDTGVPGPAAGSTSYAGVSLKPGESAVMYVTPLSVSGTQTVSSMVYEATSGVYLKVCLNTKDYCPYKTNTDISVADRNWIPASFTINSTVTTLIYVAENVANYMGAVGIDEIIIERQDGSKKSACSS